MLHFATASLPSATRCWEQRKSYQVCNNNISPNFTTGGVERTGDETPREHDTSSTGDKKVRPKTEPRTGKPKGGAGSPTILGLVAA
jgi:hypothetical protein